MIKVYLPTHLRTLAGIDGDVELEVMSPVTMTSVLNKLETVYPMLRGTIRDHVTLKRRSWLRFFACKQDISHDSPDEPLPDAIVSGDEPLMIVGAIAGG